MQPSKADACNVCGENPDPPQATVSLSHDAIKDAIAQQQAATADTEVSSVQETGSPEPMTTPVSEITQTSPSSDESTATVEPERDIWQPPTIDN